MLDEPFCIPQSILSKIQYFYDFIIHQPFKNENPEYFEEFRKVFHGYFYDCIDDREDDEDLY